MAFPGEELNLKPSDYFSKEQIELAKSYKIPKYLMLLAENLLIIIFLSIFILTPLGSKLKILCEQRCHGINWLSAGLYGVFLLVLWEIIIFPLHLYRGYLYEHRFALSNQPLSDWLKQYLLTEVISIIIFFFLVCGFYLIIKKFPYHWWFFSGTAFGIFVVLSAYLLPVLILPLFNKFHRLPEGDLRSITLKISEKAGLKIQEIYVMDASRQTKKGNAFFMGLGSTTRIVLYDTLKDNYPVAETASIIAHEVGHWKYNHIIKGISLCITGGFAFLFCLFILLTRYGISFSLSSPRDIKGLPLILLMIILINLFTLPVQNSISRYFERQADWTSLELTDDPEAFIKVEQRLAIQNLSEITPNNTFVWFLYTHPPVMERIGMGEYFRINR